MSVIFVVLPLAVLMAMVAVYAFARCVWSGQFDDLQTPAYRAIFDEVVPIRPVVAKDVLKIEKPGK